MTRMSFFLLLFCLILTSCGKPITEIFSAPKTSKQAGIIASCVSTSQAQSIAQTNGIKFRVINEKRKLIEFVDISEQELKELLPSKRLIKNKIYKKVIINKKSSTSLNAQSVDYPYYGAHSPVYATTSTYNSFTHLKQVGVNQVSAKGNGVTIAIIDTGVYYNHPHLSPNIRTSNDIHGGTADGVDSDSNGFVDDYVGWDFYNGDAYPIDDNGHGTHVAGIAAGTLSGVAPQAKILPVKVLGADGSGDLGTITAGILYAIDNGADIINLSLGGEVNSLSSDVRALINSATLAKANDVLFITAAGNGGNDGVGDCNDEADYYPANINEDNVVSVAAVDSNNSLTQYSNFGGTTVHIAAPGGDYYQGGISSTAMPYCGGPCNTKTHQTYTQMSGTSMAAPVVSGIMALVKSENPSLSLMQVRQIVLNNGIYKTEFEGLINTSSVASALEAINAL